MTADPLTRLAEFSKRPPVARVPGGSLIKRASEIRSRSIKWAWTGRLAVGYLTVQTGEEGLGKSAFDAWLAAQVTHGLLDGVWRGSPTDVLIIAGEDGLEDTWKPRLDLAGADLDRVAFLSLDALPYDWNVRDGIHDLRRAVQEADAKLVVFDALLDHMPAAQGGEGINSPTYVRGALTPLRDLVKELGIVGLFSLHPPKARGATFRDLVQASQAFTAIPRIGLFFGWHPDDVEDDPKRRRVVIRGKGNLGRNPGALAFRIDGQTLVHDDGDSQEREVVTDVTPSDLTLSSLLSRSRAPDEAVSKPDQAAEIMRCALAGGEWHPCSPIREQLHERGLNHNQTVQTARERAGVESRKRPGSRGGEWEWRIPRSPVEESYPSVLDSSAPGSPETLQTLEESEESRLKDIRLIPTCGHDAEKWRRAGSVCWTCQLCHPSALPEVAIERSK